MTAIKDHLVSAFRRIQAMEGPLTGQLRYLADDSRQRRPEFAAAVDRLEQRLRENGAGEAAPKPGEPMPPFHLPDESGHIVSLDDLLQTGPVAVTFHRGHWCPYCRVSINALSRANDEIAPRGAQIYAVMPDRQPFSS